MQWVNILNKTMSRLHKVRRCHLFQSHVCHCSTGVIIFYRDNRRASLSARLQVDCVWNVMAHAQKPEFVFRRNGRVHINRRGRQFSRLLATEMRASAVVMLDTPFSEVMWRVLATYSIRQFPLHFPSGTSPCAITFQLDSTTQVLHSLTHASWYIYIYVCIYIYIQSGPKNVYTLYSSISLD